MESRDRATAKATTLQMLHLITQIFGKRYTPYLRSSRLAWQEKTRRPSSYCKKCGSAWRDETETRQLYNNDNNNDNTRATHTAQKNLAFAVEQQQRVKETTHTDTDRAIHNEMCSHTFFHAAHLFSRLNYIRIAVSFFFLFFVVTHPSRRKAVQR